MGIGDLSTEHKHNIQMGETSKNTSGMRSVEYSGIKQKISVKKKMG
jgi:hypothetical protein